MQTLRGKITQEGENAPVIILFNEEIISFEDFEYVQLGQYKALCNRAILNSDMPTKWMIANAEGDKYAISAANQTDVVIQCFDRRGNPKDGFLTGNEFTIETK